MKTDRQYEEVFKQLMRYSRFSNVSEIEEKTDLLKFFSQVDENPHTKKAKKNVFAGNKNQGTRDAMAAAWQRLRGRHDTSPTPQHNREVVASRSAGYTAAAQKDAVVLGVTFRKGKEVPIRAYKDRSGRWRDHRGHYTRLYIEL